MNRTIGIAIALGLTGCSEKTLPSDTWVGQRSDGFPKWAIASEIPEVLHRTASESADIKSPDGKPLCYVRMAALVIPPACYETAGGDAGYFVNRLPQEATALKSKLHDAFPCGPDGHQEVVVETVVFRSYENGGAILESEQVDEARNGKGFVFGMKPLKIDDDGCTVTFAMQGVDTWTPAERATASWYTTKTVRLPLKGTHWQWATTRTGENHVLAILRLERLTKGEKWNTWKRAARGGEAPRVFAMRETRRD